jgi:hypothetical protein
MKQGMNVRATDLETVSQQHAAEWDTPDIAEFLSSFIQNKNLPDQADRGNSQSPLD